VGAQGVQLSKDDLTPADVRRVLPHGWVGCSVHSRDEAASAAKMGADFLVLGTIYPSQSHPGRTPAGLDLIRDVASLEIPVIAIGGITPLQVHEVRAAGAYGVAAIRALWHASDPAAAAVAMLAPWQESE
jgi:thiamine-phosphate diphosphorylase